MTALSGYLALMLTVLLQFEGTTSWAFESIEPIKPIILMRAHSSWVNFPMRSRRRP